MEMNAGTHAVTPHTGGLAQDVQKGWWQSGTASPATPNSLPAGPATATAHLAADGEDHFRLRRRLGRRNLLLRRR
jgi:hypothetical protein